MNEETKKALIIDLDEANRRIVQVGIELGKSISDEEEFDAMSLDTLNAVKAVRALKKRVADFAIS